MDDWVECGVDGIPNLGKTWIKLLWGKSKQELDNSDKSDKRDILPWYLCSEEMKDRVDTKSMCNEHGDG